MLDYQCDETDHAFAVPFRTSGLDRMLIINAQLVTPSIIRLSPSKTAITCHNLMGECTRYIPLEVKIQRLKSMTVSNYSAIYSS